MPKLFLLSLISCLWAAWIAQKKGRSTLFWSFLGSLFPVVVPLFLYLLPAKRRPRAVQVILEHRIDCPSCGQEIQASSKFCRFCGRAL